MYLTTEPSNIIKSDRERLLGFKFQVFWLTGLSGSGKSTLAKLLERALFEFQRNAFIIDGDNLRQGICSDLDFSEKGRTENIRRAAEIANMICNSGVIVIVALISPRIAHRNRAREIIGQKNFHEIFVDCALDVCEKRDPKGLYKMARSGEIQNFTGVSSPFEPPLSPELRIQNGTQSQQQSLKSLLDYAIKSTDLF